jgi:predicted phage tail protein
MLRKVHIDSRLLGSEGVTELSLDVDTPRMLFAALCSQVTGFREAMIDNPRLAIVITDEEKHAVASISPETFEFPLGTSAEEIFVLLPIEGSGTETIAYLIMEWEMSYAVAATVVSVATAVAINIGVSLVMMALAPSISTSGGSAKADERPSFLYGGPVNITEQGYPIPLVYGTFTVGSTVISAGVDIDEIAYVPAAITPPDTTVPAETWQWLGGGA